MKDFIVIFSVLISPWAHFPFYDKIVALAVESFLSIENNSIQLKWTYVTKPTGPWVKQHLDSYHDKHSNFLPWFVILISFSPWTKSQSQPLLVPNLTFSGLNVTFRINK
jgi:hypothetical protein